MRLKEEEEVFVRGICTKLQIFYFLKKRWRAFKCISNHTLHFDDLHRSSPRNQLVPHWKQE
jgi:hypothetical protein